MLNYDPKKAHPCAIPRRLSVFARKSVNRYGRGAIPREKSHSSCITPPRGAATAYHIGTINCNFGRPHDLITHTYFESNRLKNVGWAEGWIWCFSITSTDALNMVDPAGQPVISSNNFHTYHHCGSCEISVHFGKSKMAAATILDFAKFRIYDDVSQSLLCMGIRSSNCMLIAQSIGKFLALS